MTKAANLHIIGITDEQTECDKCGRMELRCTVIIGGDEGEVGRYGTTCASYILGIKVTRQDALSAETYRRSMVRDELRRALAAYKAGNAAEVQMYVEGARSYGIVRDDEKALIAKLTA